MARLAIPSLSVLLLSGCLTSTVEDFRYTPTAVLCERLLNTPHFNIHRKNREQVLAERGEDCSEYTHLKQTTVYVPSSASSRRISDLEDEVSDLKSSKTFECIANGGVMVGNKCL